jgi:signal transduction histidine kinase
VVGDGAAALALEGAARAGSGRVYRLAELKFEAGLFLLILVSFAAVLGQSAITSQKLVFSEGSGKFLPYAFSDGDDGGRTIVRLYPERPMAWTCDIIAGVDYPYCGYGLQLNGGAAKGGLDLSRIDKATVRFRYRGPSDHLMFSLKTVLPDAAAKKVGAAELPVGKAFAVHEGLNEVVVPFDRLEAEQWFVTQHKLSPEEARADLAHVLSLALITSGSKPGRLEAEIEEVVLEGSYLTTAQWYLIILGFWLVATGGFLVFRFFHMRRRYEARQQRLADHSQALARAHSAAEAASNAKSQFLSNMSHELRTPLNAVIGYADWLDRRDLGDKEREAVRTIRSSGEHLLAVITDILDISKIEAGKLELLPAPFDLHGCVADVGHMFRLKAADAGLEFEVEVAPDVPPRIVADQKRLRQVLINLLGNAVKFTRSGRVALRVGLAAREAGQRRLSIVVEDTGVGIPHDQQASIFRPFEQAGDALGRSGGTGLGLSISRQIVDLMNGDIRVESTPGLGSRFLIEVDVEVDEAPEATLSAPEPKRLLAAPDVVLVAPGEEDLARLLDLAKAGNLPAIRREARRLKSLDPRFAPFADHLETLCAAYQSPAVLRLIQSMSQPESAQS